MKLSLFTILISSRTFFAIFNLSLMLASVFGFLPLTVSASPYHAHLNTTERIMLYGFPAASAGIVSTLIVRRRFWGMFNALLAVLLVIVEINFSVIVSYGMARDRGAIWDVIKSNDVSFLIAAIAAIITPPEKSK